MDEGGKATGSVMLCIIKRVIKEGGAWQDLMCAQVKRMERLVSLL